MAFSVGHQREGYLSVHNMSLGGGFAGNDFCRRRISAWAFCYTIGCGQRMIYLVVKHGRRMYEV